MYLVIAVDTKKTVTMIEDYDEAEEFRFRVEESGKHCSELYFDHAMVDTHLEYYVSPDERVAMFKSLGFDLFGVFE